MLKSWFIATAMPQSDSLAIALSICAFVISLASLFFSIWSWRESNRPVVVAFIETVSGGNVGIAINLVVENVGNRPALNVSLSVKDADVALAKGNLERNVLDDVCAKCFGNRATIPVLKPAERKSNSFGFLTDGSTSTWKPESRLPITITYGEYGKQRRFSGLCDVLLSDSSSFAGGSWRPSKNG